MMLIKIYETAIFPKDICVNKMRESVDVLAYPMILTNVIDDHVIKDLIKKIDYGITNYDRRMSMIKKFKKEKTT